MRPVMLGLIAVAVFGIHAPAWAGPNDGNWQGTTAAASMRCIGTNVTLVVKDTTLGGTIAGGISSSNVITGTVAPDGSFTGTASGGNGGSISLAGKFAGDTAQFTATFFCGRENGTATRVK